MKNTNQHTLSLGTCMDILDWFNDSYFDYINHIMVAKLDSEERINRALPAISEYCLNLVDTHRASDNAYPLAA